MGGRAYDTVGRHAFLAKSGPDTKQPLWVNLADVCTNSTWTKNVHVTTPVGSFYDNAKANKVVTYDSDVSYRIKLCRGKKSLLRVMYGLAAFHVDLDDPDETCKKGAYSHLRFLQLMLRFFNLRFIAEYDYEECTKLWSGIHNK